MTFDTKRQSMLTALAIFWRKTLAESPSESSCSRAGICRARLASFIAVIAGALAIEDEDERHALHPPVCSTIHKSLHDARRVIQDQKPMDMLERSSQLAQRP